MQVPYCEVEVVEGLHRFALFGTEVFKRSRAGACAMVSAACLKAAREQARRAAEEVLLPGKNLQLWGIYMNLRVCADSHMASCDILWAYASNEKHN